MTDTIDTSTYVPQFYEISPPELKYVTDDSGKTRYFYLQTYKGLTHEKPDELYLETDVNKLDSEDYSKSTLVVQMIQKIWHGIRRLLNALSIYNYNKICIDHRYINTEINCQNLYEILLSEKYAHPTSSTDDEDTYSSYITKYVNKRQRFPSDHATLSYLFYSQFAKNNIDLSAWSELVCLNVMRFIALIKPVIDQNNDNDEKNFFHASMLETLVISISKSKSIRMGDLNYNEGYSPEENVIRFANYMIQEGMIDQTQLEKLQTQDLKTIFNFLANYRTDDESNPDNTVAQERNTLRGRLSEIITSRPESQPEFPPVSFKTPNRKTSHKPETPMSMQERFNQALYGTPVHMIEL